MEPTNTDNPITTHTPSRSQDPAPPNEPHPTFSRECKHVEASSSTKSASLGMKLVFATYPFSQSIVYTTNRFSQTLFQNQDDLHKHLFKTRTTFTNTFSNPGWPSQTPFQKQDDLHKHIFKNRTIFTYTFSQPNQFSQTLFDNQPIFTTTPFSQPTHFENMPWLSSHFPISIESRWGFQTATSNSPNATCGAFRRSKDR